MFGTMDRLRTVGRACRCRDDAMAHRRPLVRRQSLRAAGGLAALALVVAFSVMVSGEVTSLRARIAGLEDRAACGEAESADLSRRWVAATSPDVIIPQAEAGGLEVSRTPDFVIVPVQEPAAAGAGLLARVLSGLAGGTEAEAAVSPTFVTGSMVSLDPPARRDGRAGATP